MSRRFAGMVVALAVAVLSCCAATAHAKTYQGSIGTPVVGADGTSVSAPVSMTAICAPTEYCGFFPVVTTVPDSQSCSPAITGSTWVGTLVSSPLLPSTPTPPSMAATATWYEWPTLYAGGKRACLYSGTDEVLVAQTTYAVPAPPMPTPYQPVAPVPASAPVPTAQAPLAQSLGNGEAITVARRWMKQSYGRRWSRGLHRVARCPVRSSSAQIGCYAVWTFKTRVYSRSIVITETETKYLISRDFTSAPPQAVSAPASGDFCATHVCIPNYPNGTGSTVRCRDGSYSHSGGRQGACSHHGGVAHTASLFRRTRPSARNAGAESALQVARQRAQFQARQ